LTAWPTIWDDVGPAEGNPQPVKAITAQQLNRAVIFISVHACLRMHSTVYHPGVKSRFRTRRLQPWPILRLLTAT
jgi:hypothetical protein